MVATVAAVIATPTIATAGGWGASGQGAVRANSGTIVAPTAPGVTTAAGTSVTVTWTASTTTQVTGYTILRSSSADGTYTQVGTVNGRTTTSWTDTSAPANGSSWYRVRATRANWGDRSTARGRVVSGYDIDARTQTTAPVYRLSWYSRYKTADPYYNNTYNTSWTCGPVITGDPLPCRSPDGRTLCDHTGSLRGATVIREGAPRTVGSRNYLPSNDEDGRNSCQWQNWTASSYVATAYSAWAPAGPSDYTTAAPRDTAHSSCLADTTYKTSCAKTDIAATYSDTTTTGTDCPTNTSTATYTCTPIWESRAAS